MKLTTATATPSEPRGPRVHVGSGSGGADDREPGDYQEDADHEAPAEVQVWRPHVDLGGGTSGDGQGSEVKKRPAAEGGTAEQG